MPIPLLFNVYAAGSGGVPSTSVFYGDLRNRIESYQHTIVATGGFETCTITFNATLAEAVQWLNRLMASVQVGAPSGGIVWEGFLSQVQATIGQEQRSQSLDAMANRVRARYQTVLGTAAVTATSSDSTSIARYGTKDYILALNESDKAAAEKFRDQVLGVRKLPMSAPNSTAASGDMGGVSVTLTFTGWYYALDWLVTSVTTTSSAVTTTQIGTLITSYNATNNFIASTSITASAVNQTQFVAPDTTYRAAIERLLKSGNSAGQRYAWGVYENRQFQAFIWAGSTPTTLTYRRSIREGQITKYMSPVAAWDVRPDAMAQTIELLDVTQNTSTSDTSARFYVERVTCSISGDNVGVALEPQASDALDAQLARIGVGI